MDQSHKGFHVYYSSNLNNKCPIKKEVQLVQYEHQFLLELHAKVTHIQGMSLQTLQLLAHLEQNLQKPYNVICKAISCSLLRGA